MNLLSAYLI